LGYKRFYENMDVCSSLYKFAITLHKKLQLFLLLLKLSLTTFLSLVLLCLII